MNTTHCSTPGIVLRRRSYGDFDVIVTLMTRDHGKRTLMAKAAKKSKKRFGGLLEPFAGLQVVFRMGKGMPLLEEASLVQSFDGVRTDIVKTAYGSYWLELIDLWVEEKQERPELYHLLGFALQALGEGDRAAAMLSILFQMRFIGHEGLAPVLERCACCHKRIEALPLQRFCIDLNKGGIVCQSCPADRNGRLMLSRDTLKHLQWMVDGSLEKAQRARLGPHVLTEATHFLEAFVPYHIGRLPKSLVFLQQMRRSAVK
ncbi:MAG: DNA repair protein RecO [Desulfosarcinaceae bacterium]